MGNGLPTLTNADELPGRVASVAEPDTKEPALAGVRRHASVVGGAEAGTIDILATDHAPHARPEKQGRSFSSAAFGLVGSELALPIMMSLVRARN